MLAGKSPSAADILREATIENFLVPSEERTTILSALQAALEVMEETPGDYRAHVEKVHGFLTALWTKYDCKDVIDILDALTRVEPPLVDYGRSVSKGYRDHYVHIFSVYILGLMILASIIEKLGDHTRDLLKVRDEEVSSVIPEFSHNYSWKERLFYLWTLIATFHDISIPVTRLGSVRDGLKQFMEQFNIECSGPTLLPFHPSDLEDYFESLGRLFQGKLEVDNSWCYKIEQCNFYVPGVLRREFARQNHGVLSALLMYQKFREIFLEGRTKRPLSPESFDAFTKYILKQDIARAALAISLHDLKPDEKTGYPKFFPLEFFEYPLTCLLILVDGLQEYLHWEGTSIRGGTKLLLFPELAIDAAINHIQLDVAFFVTDEPEAQNYLISQAQALALNERRSLRGSGLGEAAQDLCSSVAEDLASRLRKNRAFEAVLYFYENDRKLLSRRVHV
jgi:hypothetical protein